MYMVNPDNLEKHDTVVVKEHGGHYRADVLSISTRDDGQKLVGVQLIYIHEKPSYDIECGETANVRPEEIIEVL